MLASTASQEMKSKELGQIFMTESRQTVFVYIVHKML